MSEVIKTTAPIAIDQLKRYFADKSLSYVIDYENSTLDGQKLLTYIGNLDLPIDVSLDFSKERDRELLALYFKTGSLVSIPSLESAAFECLLEYKKIVPFTNYKQFLSDHSDLVKEWASRLDSLMLYNLYCIKSDEIQTLVNGYPQSEADSTEYVNFVNLLKYPEFYAYYAASESEDLVNYTRLFNDYCFKGNNMFTYWAISDNPIFIRTWGIVNNIQSQGDNHVSLI